MSAYQDDPTPPETPAERAEAAATRRRWLTLAEVVAIAGVVIAALTLWNNWQGREADLAQQRAAAAQAASASQAGAVVTLTAKPADGGDRLVLKDASHDVQSISVIFPTALGVAPQTSSVDLEIDSRWFDHALLKAIVSGPADQTGRLPIIVTADYWIGDEHRTDRAIYDVAWATHGRLLRGRVLELKGLMLERRHGATQAALNALWKARTPAAGS